jgi:hypothetical protein
MQRPSPHATRTSGSPRRRRPNAAPSLFDLVPERTPAPPADDGAERLMSDLVELIDAGLVVAVEVDGETRYAAAPIDLDEPDR